VWYHTTYLYSVAPCLHNSKNLSDYCYFISFYSISFHFTFHIMYVISPMYYVRGFYSQQYEKEHNILLWVTAVTGFNAERSSESMHSNILGPAGILTQDCLNTRCTYTTKPQGPCRGAAHAHMVYTYNNTDLFTLCIIKAWASCLSCILACFVHYE